MRGILYVVFVCFCLHSLVFGASRNLSVSDPMPAFSFVDQDGNHFQYPVAEKTVLLVVFFSPDKKQSISAIKDIEQIAGNLREVPFPLTVVAVSDDPNTVTSLSIKNTQKISTYLVHDSDFKLWGEFGVIAAPTVFLAGMDGKIALIKAGHGYDFAPAVKSKLLEILGLAPGTDIADIRHVRTVTNTSDREKANRHVKLAEMLENRRDYEAALTQMQTAVQIDPNCVDCRLHLGRLYCQVSKPDQAIETVSGLEPENPVNQALRNYILGRAYAQLKDHDRAEEYLLTAIQLDPSNGRAYYELGKIYQRQNRKDAALEYYRKSLDIVYSD